MTFQNLDEKVMIGWADNWDYAAQAPTAESGFRGKMTLAREMKLVKTEQGYRLSFSFKGTEAWRPYRSLWHRVITGCTRIPSG